MNRIKEFYRISRPAPKRELDDTACDRYYRRLRLQAFIAAYARIQSLLRLPHESQRRQESRCSTAGRSTPHNWASSGRRSCSPMPSASSSTAFIADHSNIKRFMATGLVRFGRRQTLLIGRTGPRRQCGHPHGNMTLFVAFAVMWGAQRLGAIDGRTAGDHRPLDAGIPSAERGTYYGFFSCQPQPRRVLFVPLRRVDRDLRRMAGRLRRIGGGGSHRGNRHPLPGFTTPLNPKDCLRSRLWRMKSPGPKPDRSVKEIQKQVLKTPAVWILAAASAFMYVSRYAVNGWGVLFSAGGQRATRWQRGHHRSYRSTPCSGIRRDRTFRAGSPTRCCTGRPTTVPALGIRRAEYRRADVCSCTAVQTACASTC